MNMPVPRDMKALSEANMELEELYLGIPDESVNLTFQDMAVVGDQNKKEAPAPIQETNHNLAKLPSLDFSRGLEAAYHNQHHVAFSYDHHQDHMSTDSTYHPGGGRSRRPGIPHSNICTICSSYVYIFRHRCLVCGRMYCRDCVMMGMGEMLEGRKCTQCLGKRFSQRYIQRAGQVGCCSRYPSSVKQAELKWAEKGPRRIGERSYAHSNIMSMTSKSPIRAHPTISSHSQSSFVSNSPFSPYTPNHHHLPL